MFSANYIQVVEAGWQRLHLLTPIRFRLPSLGEGQPGEGRNGDKEGAEQFTMRFLELFFCFRKSSTILSQSGFYITRPCTNLDVNVRAIEAMGTTT